MGIDDWDIVVVSHNSGEVIREIWASQPPELLERVVCVENGNSGASLEAVRSIFGRVLTSPNEGLSAANNLGWSHGTAQYVLFANPDLHCVPSDLDHLAAHLTRYGGIVAPRLVHPDGAPQESCRGWPSPYRQVLNQLLHPTHRKNQPYLWPSTGERAVPWVLGAAVATRREDLVQAQGWPEEYFLYFEDTELASRYQRSGLSVAVLEELRWIHEWSRGSRFSIRLRAMHARSAMRFYSKHPLLALGIRPTPRLTEL